MQFAAAWSLSFYAIPLIAFSMYKRGAPLADAYVLLQVMAGAGFLFFSSMMARGYSRANNPTYMKFVKTLEQAKVDYNSNVRQELGKYDFDFWAWPVDFNGTTDEQ